MLNISEMEGVCICVFVNECIMLLSEKKIESKQVILKGKIFHLKFFLEK